MNRLVSAAFILLLAACSNTAGVAEFRVYAEAVDALAIASEPLVDRLGVAERRNAVELIDQGTAPGGEVVAGAQAGDPAKGLAPHFKLQHAAYFAKSGDPPFAGAIRASVASLRRFNAAALVYAEGRALDDARTDLTATTANITGGFTALAAASGVSIAAPAVGPAVKAFLEGASIFGEFGSRDAFRDILREEGARIDTLLTALMENAPIAFNALTESDFERRGDLILEGADITEVTARIVKEREILAEWVLLIRDAKTLLADTLRAIDAPQTLGGGVAVASELSGDIRARLERIRVLTAGGG